jgi:hypothetical protein
MSTKVYQVGEIETDRTLLQRVVGFQSLSQVLSYFLYVGLGFFLLFLVQALLGFSFVNMHVLIGGLVGSMGAVYAALPCHFFICGTDVSGAIMHIKSELSLMGYVEGKRHGVFESRLPEILCWKENRIELHLVSRECLIVYGPKLPLRRIRNSLNTTQW